MIILISDANILIDMEEGDLLDALFELPYQFTVPDLLYFDELETHHADLLDKGLGTRSLRWMARAELIVRCETVAGACHGILPSRS